MNVFFKYGVSFFVIFLTGCVEPYQPAVEKSSQHVLVVDGFINTTTSSASVHLTRTKPIDDKTFTSEQKAKVLVEEESGNTYPLAEVSPGQYEAKALPVVSSKRYRLKVTTADAKEFASAFVRLQQVPAIDSVSWTPSPEGLSVNVSTHDPTNNTQYYLWKTEETWRYRAAYRSEFRFKGTTVVNRTSSELIYDCWRSANSSKILIATTSHLGEDRVSEFQLVFIPKNSRKILLRYSILVKQFGLDKDAFEYWRQLQKTTENLGGLFDPLPGQTQGNISCTSVPEEPVLGYFSGGSISEKRIFIDLYDLPKYLYGSALRPDCKADSIPNEQLSVVNGSFNLVAPIYRGLAVIGYTAATFECSDCRLEGGTLTKPDFWE